LNLRRFVDPEHEDYVFKPEYHKKIPIDGLPRFVEDIWVHFFCYFFFK